MPITSHSLSYREHEEDDSPHTGFMVGNNSYYFFNIAFCGRRHLCFRRFCDNKIVGYINQFSNILSIYVKYILRKKSDAVPRSFRKKRKFFSLCSS